MLMVEMLITICSPTLGMLVGTGDVACLDQIYGDVFSQAYKKLSNQSNVRSARRLGSVQ